MSHCINITPIIPKATAKQNEEAKEWFDEYVRLSNAEFQHLKNVVNSDARSDYFNGAMRLYANGEYSDMIHEAFHDFSQEFLTPEQKKHMYDEAKHADAGKKAIFDAEQRKKAKLDESEKFNALEEMLAKDFQNYKQTGKILDGRAKRNNIFRRMWDWLKKLFSKEMPSIETIYQRLGGLDFAQYKRSKDNVFFGHLNKSVDGISIKDTVHLMSALDSFIAEQFRDEGLYIPGLFKDKHAIQNVYHNMLVDFNANYEHWLDHYNENLEVYVTSPDDVKETLAPELARISRRVDNLKFIVENWDQIRAMHLTESRYLKIGKQFVPEEIIDELEPSAKDQMYDDKDDKSVRDVAAKQLIFLMATLRKYQFVGGEAIPKANAYIDIIGDVADFDRSWNTLAKTLTGERDYTRMWAKMQRLAVTNPEYNDLLSSLPAPGKPGNDMSLLETQLVAQFVGTFSQPLVDRKIINFWNEDGKLRVNAKQGAAKSMDRLKEDWRDSIQENSNPTVAPYRIYNPETRQYFIDVAKIAEDFANITKASRQKKEQFLASIGLTFSPTTLDSPEYKELLEASPSIGRLYTAVKNYAELQAGTHEQKAALTKGQREALAKPILSIAEAIEKTMYGRSKEYLKTNGTKPRLVAGQKETLEEIGNMELKYSDKFFSDNTLNSEGHSVYGIKQWSQQTVLYSLLNDPSIVSYDQLIKTPLGAYFDFSKNPDANNIYVNAVFDVATGKRKTDRKGNPVILNLYNHDGWNINTKDASDPESVGENIGSKTIRLERVEKLLQDISALLLFGNKEHLRYGDKTTSNGTETTFDRLTEDSQGHTYLPVDYVDFAGGVQLPKEAAAIFRQILQSALQLTNDYFTAGIGKNFDNFHQNMLKKEYWGFFDEILSEATKAKLLEDGLITEAGLDTYALIDKHIDDVNADVEAFLKKDTESLLAELASNPILGPSDILAHDLLQEERMGKTEHERYEAYIAAFAVNSYILNTEHVRLFFQDPRFYDNKKGNYKEIFKRISKASSTGVMALNDAQMNAYLTKTGKQERAQYNRDHPDAPAELTPETGIEPTAIFGDVITKGTDFVEQIDKNFPNASPDEKEALQKAYGKIEATDAFGICTLDFARSWEIRTGDDNWNNEKDLLYNKLARGEEIATDDTLKAVDFFPQIKIRQTGYVFDEASGRFCPIDYKLSLMPLLPHIVKGSAFETIRENMLRQNVSIATFKTASKHSSITAAGKHNNLYNADGSINTGDYAINPVHVEYTFEVVASPDHFKGESTYPTQRRKLLFSNSFEGGVPVDYREGNWNNLTEDEKRAKSKVYTNEQDYGQAIENLINAGKDRLLRNLGAKMDSAGNFTVDDAKLSDLLEKEFKKRNLPQNTRLSVQTVNGKLKYALDASLSRETIEQVLISIVDNRLRRQKTPGEGLIMASAIGSEAKDFKRIEAWDTIDGSDLAFYKKEGRTLPDGTKVTSAMKIKLALQGDFKNLLNHPDIKKRVADTGEDPVTVLNELIKDEKWLDKGENRAMLTVNGDKIPIQGINSQEFAEIYHFFPESAGPVVMFSPGWVAKSGGDFDWDKNSARFPRITKTAKLYKTVSEARLVEIRQKQKHLENQLKSSVAALDEADIIDHNLREEIEMYAFNLFNEEDSIVQEAKEALAKIRKQEAKLEAKGERLWEEIEQLKDLADEMDNKAAYQNEIARIERATLERTDLYDQLVMPNSTFMFEGIADRRQAALSRGEAIPNSYAKIGTVQESLNQFTSNTVGRQALGIGAIFNAFFPQLQKAGAVLQNQYISNPTYPKHKKTTNNRLPHNTIKGNISVSGIYSRKYEGTKYRISEAMSQLMNGWVDVAKKDWVFYINGVKEIAPKMLFASMTGIHKDILVGFFNQPILTDYIKNLANYKSDMVKLRHPELYKNAALHAIYDTIEKWLPEDTMILTRQKKNPLKNALELLEGEMSKLQSPDTKVAGKAAAFAYGHLNYGFRQLANDNADLFDPEHFMKFAIPHNAETDKAKPPVWTLHLPSTEREKLAQVLYLIQYLEFKEQQGIMDTYRRTLNQDTTKPENLQDSHERTLEREQLHLYGLISTDHVSKMADEGTIRGFTKKSGGIDHFLQQLTHGTFEVTNHPWFNQFLYNEFNDTPEKNNIPFDKKFAIWADWVKDVKNDFILYLYQNYVYKPGTNTLVVQDVKTLMKYKTALALELESLKRNHPDLVRNNLLLDFLIRDNSREKLDNRPKLVSLKLKKSRLDTSTSDILTEAFDELFNSPIPEVANFAQKLGYFSFIQSGLSKSDISFGTILPQDVYGADMTQIIQSFKELMNNNPEQALSELNAFYKKFKINHRNYFKAGTVVDENGTERANIKFATETKRFKDYLNPRATDLLSKKRNIALVKDQEARQAIIKKTSVAPEVWTKDSAKDNPNTFYVYEINEKGSGQLGSSKVRGSGSEKGTLPNTGGIVTMKKAAADGWWTDTTYDSNISQIDASISSLVAKIVTANPEKVLLPADLFSVSKIKERAPNTYEYLIDQLQTHLGYVAPDEVSTKPVAPVDPGTTHSTVTEFETDGTAYRFDGETYSQERGVYETETPFQEINVARQEFSNDLLEGGEIDPESAKIYEKMLSLPIEEVNRRIKLCE